MFINFTDVMHIKNNASTSWERDAGLMTRHFGDKMIVKGAQAKMKMVRFSFSYISKPGLLFSLLLCLPPIINRVFWGVDTRILKIRCSGLEIVRKPTSN